MARVSLILVIDPDGPPPTELVPPLRQALEAAGHEVEVLVVAESAEGPGWRGVTSETDRFGPAAAAISALERAGGDVLLVLETALGYGPDDLPRVAAPLAEGRADLVVASRSAADPTLPTPRAVWSWTGRLARPLTGTTDPFSGLIGLSRALFHAADPGFRAIGSKFSFELLARLGGRWVDVPVRVAAPWRPRRPALNDVRQLKRLADHRFGNLSRLVQFCVVGGSGMVVDLSAYFLFQLALFRVPWLAEHRIPPTRVTWALALARGLAVSVALVWNFSLNRRLTFSYARNDSVARQFLKYVLSNALGVGLSLALSLGLPSWSAFFRAHKLAAAVVGIVAATGVSFSMSRWVVFNNQGGEGPKNGRDGPRAGRAAGRDKKNRGRTHRGHPVGTIDGVD